MPGTTLLEPRRRPQTGVSLPVLLCFLAATTDRLKIPMQHCGVSGLHIPYVSYFGLGRKLTEGESHQKV